MWSQSPAPWRLRAAALLELIGVFVAGTVVARLIASAIGLDGGGLRDVKPGASVDYLALAWSTGATLVLRYGVILGLAFTLGWCYRRRRLSSYGVSAAGLPARVHLAIAVVLFAAGGFLPKLLIFLKDHVPLGQGPRHWDLIANADSLPFWIYMAVASFGLVPLVEELFFRGYVQTRLTDTFGAPAAIVMTALLFTLSHRQYFIPSILGAGMIVSLFVGALFASYVRHRYDSLVPAIIAHALGNVPIRGTLQVVLLISMAMVMVVARRLLRLHARELAALVRTRAVLAGALLTVGVVVVVLLIATLGRTALLSFGGFALTVAIVLARNERHAKWLQRAPRRSHHADM